MLFLEAAFCIFWIYITSIHENHAMLFNLKMTNSTESLMLAEAAGHDFLQVRELKCSEPPCFLDEKPNAF